MARRTILVPIDLHGITRDAMETVVRLARQLDRPLLGLVLEDVRLQQVAALPFATEITLLGGRERSLLRDHLSQRHSLVSGDSRRLLHELAHREQVELVFETSSGTRLHCALERGGQLDVFFPARQRWQRARPSRPANGRPFQRLGLVLAGCEQDARVLEAAALLLRAQLVADVYVLSVGRLDRSLLEGLYLPGSRISVQANLHRDPASIARLIRQSSYDLLLLPGQCLQGIGPQTLDATLDKSGGQVLVIN